MLSALGLPLIVVSYPTKYTITWQAEQAGFGR